MMPFHLSSKIQSVARHGSGSSSSSSSSRNCRQQLEQHDPGTTTFASDDANARVGVVNRNDVRTHRKTHHEDEDGCFVYQVTSPAGITVRSLPCIDDEYRTSKSFSKDDLVSVDHIRHCQNHSNISGGRVATIGNEKEDRNEHGPFLRLSDSSGFLFEAKNGKPVMKRLHVDTGLWTFYVDNVPHGQVLRNHPCEDDDGNDRRLDKVVYQPMQKIYCDKRVKHPITGDTHFRVQGKCGWVVDRSIDTKTGTSRRTLCDECDVQIGLFAFRAINNMAIRSRPSVRDEYMTSRAIKKGDIVIIDVIRDVDDEPTDSDQVIDLSSTASDEKPSARSSASVMQLQTESRKNTGNANGPFLRLSDGSGWIFQNKSYVKMMEPVSIQTGSWRLRVANEKGVLLRRHPIIEASNRKTSLWATEDHYERNKIVVCDRRVSVGGSSNTGKSLMVNEDRSESFHDDGLHFYRVQSTQGWLCDRFDGQMMMDLLSPSSKPNPTCANFSIHRNNGWSPDFVRGIASIVEGMKEVSINPEKCCMSFRPSVIVDQIRINVYYATRTVGIAKQHGDSGKTQLFWRDCTPQLLLEILQNPEIHHHGTTVDNSKRRRHCSNKKRSRAETDAAMTLVVGLNGSSSCDDDGNKKNTPCMEETEEEELRQGLIQYMKEKEEIQNKYDEALSVIRSIDNERASEAIMMQENIQLREEEDAKYRANSTASKTEIQSHNGVDNRRIATISQRSAHIEFETDAGGKTGNEYPQGAGDLDLNPAALPPQFHQPHHHHQYHPAIALGMYPRQGVEQYLRRQQQQRQMQQHVVEIQSRTCRICGFVHASAPAREQHERDLHGVSPTSAINTTFFDRSSTTSPSTHQGKIHEI